MVRKFFNLVFQFWSLFSTNKQSNVPSLYLSIRQVVYIFQSKKQGSNLRIDVRRHIFLGRGVQILFLPSNAARGEIKMDLFKRFLIFRQKNFWKILINIMQHSVYNLIISGQQVWDNRSLVIQKWLSFLKLRIHSLHVLLLIMENSGIQVHFNS